MPRRYILAIIAVGLVFFLGILILIGILTRNTLSNSGDSVSTEEVERILDADVHGVTFTTYGAVVAEEDRRAIRIHITANERRLEILQGYFETVEKSETLENNFIAFDDLVIALKSAGYDQFNPRVETDRRSVCVTGTTFTYEATAAEDRDLDSWSTSCSSKQGSFEGNARLVRTLMQDQFPDYNEFVSGVKL